MTLPAYHKGDIVRIEKARGRCRSDTNRVRTGKVTYVKKDMVVIRYLPLNTRTDLPIWMIPDIEKPMLGGYKEAFTGIDINRLSKVQGGVISGN